MEYKQSRPGDRLAWIWLALGASLLPFAYLQTIWPIPAWLSPVFLMRLSRTQRLTIGLPLLLDSSSAQLLDGAQRWPLSSPDLNRWKHRSRSPEPDL